MRSPYSREDIQGVEAADPGHSKVVLNKEHYDRCSYCHSKLVHAHDLNLSNLEVVETSRCPGCGVSAHPKKFTLH